MSMENLTPITREEKIISGEDLQPITRMEYFLKKYGGGTGGGSSVLLDTTLTKSGYAADAKAVGDRLSAIGNGGGASGGGVANLVTPITHAELVALRDNSNLVPCMFYRITDYVCTTVQDDSRAMSNKFDIIVQALSKNTLSENASADHNEQDDYFGKSNLQAWELKYCLDNDTTRFAWADEENGKGVIYYMKDEFDNECPYDFKNIQFKRKISLEAGYPKLDEENGEETWVYTFCANYYHIDNDEWSELKDGSLESPYGHESDEMSTTFQNNIIGEYIFLYEPENEDYTKCGRRSLNNNVFFGYFEEIGSTSPENHPYYYAYCSNNNILGNHCYNNTFGIGSNSNTFGNECDNNTFGTGGSSNTFGNECDNNTFGNGCGSNTFGNKCDNNTFGNECGYNTFGNECNSNTFGIGSNSNTFGNNCGRNTFGDGFGFNTFGNNCDNNTFGNRCEYNEVGNGCNYVIINGDNVNYIEVESGLHSAAITPETNVEYKQNYRRTGSKEVLI